MKQAISGRPQQLYTTLESIGVEMAPNRGPVTMPAEVFIYLVSLIIAFENAADHPPGSTAQVISARFKDWLPKRHSDA